MALKNLGMKTLIEHVQSQFSTVSISLIHMDVKNLGELCSQQFQFTGYKTEVDQAVFMLKTQIEKYDAAVVELPDEKLSTKFSETLYNFNVFQYNVVI